MQKVSSDTPNLNLATPGWLRLALSLAVCALLGLGWYVSISHWRRPDAYTLSVLQLQGDPIKGQSLFSLNCSGCHGSEANGHVGPSLHGVSERRSDRSLIEQVTSGKTLPMPQFQPAPEEMADLLSYLRSLH